MHKGELTSEKEGDVGKREKLSPPISLLCIQIFPLWRPGSPEPQSPSSSGPSNNATTTRLCQPRIQESRPPTPPWTEMPKPRSPVPSSFRSPPPQAPSPSDQRWGSQTPLSGLTQESGPQSQPRPFRDWVCYSAKWGLPGLWAGPCLGLGGARTSV